MDKMPIVDSTLRGSWLKYQKEQVLEALKAQRDADQKILEETVGEIFKDIVRLGYLISNEDYAELKQKYLGGG